MNIKRIAKHFLMTRWHVNKSFPAATLDAIEKEISVSEARHAGEIRFVVEGALDGAQLGKPLPQVWVVETVAVVEEPEVWGVESVGPDAVVVRVVVKTKPSERPNVARELRERIKAAFDAEGVEMPFPQNSVWMRPENPRATRPAAGSTPVEG